MIDQSKEFIRCLINSAVRAPDECPHGRPGRLLRSGSGTLVRDGGCHYGGRGCDGVVVRGYRVHDHGLGIGVNRGGFVVSCGCIHVAAVIPATDVPAIVIPATAGIPTVEIPAIEIPATAGIPTATAVAAAPVGVSSPSRCGSSAAGGCRAAAAMGDTAPAVSCPTSTLESPSPSVGHPASAVECPTAAMDCSAAVDCPSSAMGCTASAVDCPPSASASPPATTATAARLGCTGTKRENGACRKCRQQSRPDKTPLHGVTPIGFSGPSRPARPFAAIGLSQARDTLPCRYRMSGCFLTASRGPPCSQRAAVAV
jgi:hypothetical protein